MKPLHGDKRFRGHIHKAKNIFKQLKIYSMLITQLIKKLSRMRN